MLKVNDYVRYGAKGVFQIKEIQKRRNKENKKVDFYVLYNNTDGVETKIVTPAKNDSIRKVMSKEDALSLIQNMEHIEIIWDNNKRTRDDLFREMLTSGNMTKIAQLLKSIHFTRLEKIKEGKDISQRDKEVYNNAENLLFEELSVCFDISKNEVLDLILSNVQN